MLHGIALSSNVLLAWSAYLVGTASPGPSNLAIMSLAMNDGRKTALVFALGVLSGSFFWAMLAMFGLSAALAMYSKVLIAIKIVGGAYLLWLGVQSARRAMQRGEAARPVAARSQTLKRTYVRGLLLHLTNPKAILVWLSIVSLAVPVTLGGVGVASVTAALPAVLGCMTIGPVVFCSYAVLFSTPAARRIYLAVRRWFEGTLAVVFGFAGLTMIVRAGG